MLRKPASLESWSSCPWRMTVLTVSIHSGQIEFSQAPGAIDESLWDSKSVAAVRPSQGQSAGAQGPGSAVG